MTNEDKLREIFHKTIFVQHKESDKLTALVCSDEWLNAEYQEPTTKNDLGVDCISRDDVRDVMQELWGTSGELMDRLMALPSVTPQEPRKGYWEHGKELCREYQGKTLVNITYKDWHCSNCHCVIEQSEKPKWNFCPNCGAKMGEPQESEEI